MRQSIGLQRVGHDWVWLDNNNMTLLVYFQILVLLQKVPKGTPNVDILDPHSHSIISQMRTFSLPPNIHAYLQLQLWPSFPLRPKKQLHHFVFRWSPLFHSGSFSSSLWGENKLAKMAWSGSLPPCSINNDYVTTEIIYSTAHACHEVYVTVEVTYNTSQGILCCRHIWAQPKKAEAFYCCLMAVSTGSPMRGENKHVGSSYVSSSLLPAS